MFTWGRHWTNSLAGSNYSSRLYFISLRFDWHITPISTSRSHEWSFSVSFKKKNFYTALDIHQFHKSLCGHGLVKWLTVTNVPGTVTASIVMSLLSNTRLFLYQQAVRENQNCGPSRPHDFETNNIYTCQLRHHWGKWCGSASCW